MPLCVVIVCSSSLLLFSASARLCNSIYSFIYNHFELGYDKPSRIIQVQIGIDEDVVSGRCYMGRAKRKGVLEHAQHAKIQIHPAHA